MIFTCYFQLVIFNFSVMGSTIFFSAKKLTERWYLLGLFELSIIFQDFANTVFRAVEIKISNKSFRSFLLTKNNLSFITNAASKEKILKKTAFLHLSSSCGVNSISTKILHLVQDQISKHLGTVCNLSFSTGIFPTILKIARVIPIHKKDSKLEVCN